MLISKMVKKNFDLNLIYVDIIVHYVVLNIINILGCFNILLIITLIKLIDSFLCLNIFSFQLLIILYPLCNFAFI